jgi:hypothetical protein
MTDLNSVWRVCSNCKKPIRYSQIYWICSVSTCNRKRTGLVFCTIGCWDAHLPLANHRSAGAEQAQAPAAGGTSKR